MTLGLFCTASMLPSASTWPSCNTVTRWAREGRLACLVTLGGHHRFDREVVEQLRKQQYREKQDRD